MKMATEAQKLISLSIGKITDSRKQRGGINLCKNLLVSTVLFKARTIYMMENYQKLHDNKQQKREAKIAQKATKKAENLDTPMSTEVDPAKCTRSDPDVTPTDNKENIPVNKQPEESNTQLDCKSPKAKLSESGESITEHSDNSAVCGQCTKRRRSELSDVGSDNSNNESKGHDTESVSPVKKSKTDSGPTDGHGLHFTKETPHNDDSQPEPMHTDPPQISNLVNIFNTGFTGICGSEQNHSDFSQQTCIKEVPSFVDSLSRPVNTLLTV